MDSIKWTKRGKIVVGIYLLVLSLIFLYSFDYVVGYVNSTNESEVSNINGIKESAPTENTDSPLDETKEEIDVDNDESDKASEEIDNEKDADSSSLESKAYSTEDLNILKEANISLLFMPQSHSLNDENIKSLLSFLSVIKDYPNEILVIEGHSDGYPSYESSVLEKELAQKRSDAVYQFLIDNGARANNIKLVNLGSSSPISRNYDDRFKNNRVDLYFLNHASKGSYGK